MISGRGAVWKRIPHRYAGVLGDDKSEIKSFVCDAEIREENRGVAQSGSASRIGMREFWRMINQKSSLSYVMQR